MDKDTPYILSCILFFDNIIDRFFDQYLFYSIDDHCI